jgi:hypothetical protein
MSKIIKVTLLSAVLLQIGFAQIKGAPTPIGIPVLPVPFNGTVVSGPSVGPDGTAYVIINVLQTSTTPVSMKTELVSVSEGAKQNWSATLPGQFVSPPAFGPANTPAKNLIFISLSEPQVLPLATASNPVSTTGSLLIVDAATGNVHTPVSISANTLSPPQVSPDGTVVYIIGQISPLLTPGTAGAGTSLTPGGAKLYVYSVATGGLSSITLF